MFFFKKKLYLNLKRKWIPAIHTIKVTVRYFTYHDGIKEKKFF